MMSGVDVLITYGENVSRRFDKFSNTGDDVTWETEESCAHKCGHSDRPPCSRCVVDKISMSQTECKETNASKKKCRINRYNNNIVFHKTKLFGFFQFFLNRNTSLYGMFIVFI